MVIALLGTNKKRRGISHMLPFYLIYLQSPLVKIEVVTGDLSFWRLLKWTLEERPDTNVGHGSKVPSLRGSVYVGLSC